MFIESPLCALAIWNVCLRYLTCDGVASLASHSLILQHLVYCNVSTWIYELITSSMFVNVKHVTKKNNNGKNLQTQAKQIIVEPLAYGMFHGFNVHNARDRHSKTNWFFRNRNRIHLRVEIENISWKRNSSCLQSQRDLSLVLNGYAIYFAFRIYFHTQLLLSAFH